MPGHIIRGASSKEAARALGIAPRTVEFHRANILRKVKAKNTVELVQRVLNPKRKLRAATSTDRQRSIALNQTNGC